MSGPPVGAPPPTLAISTLETPTPSARRGWRGLIAVLLVLAIYVALWVAYSANGLVDFGRYRQLAPGATGTLEGVDYRVLSMKQSSVLADQDGDDPAASLPNTVWVVAELELTRTPTSTASYCSLRLLGPDRREWETTYPPSSRTIQTSCDVRELEVGRPTTYEAIFQIPSADADEVGGIVLLNVANADPDQVIRPA